MASKFPATRLFVQSLDQACNKNQNSTSLGHCEGNSSVTGRFPAQMAINADIVTMSWSFQERKYTSCQNLGSLRVLQVSTILQNITIVTQINKDAPTITAKSWWRHQMEAFSALLTLCAGNSPITGEFPSQRPVTRSFDVFFDLRLNKRLSKQSRGRWF